MSTTTAADVTAQLRWRYAVKQFDATRTIPDHTWSALEDALVLTPSSYGLQPWRFIVVTDPAVKAELRPAAWNQSQVTDCSHFVVFAIRKGLSLADVDHFIARTAAVRGVTGESLAGYRGFIVKDLIEGPRAKIVDDWSARQAYIALGNFLTCAALTGIDACPMEGFEPGKFDAILRLGATGHTAVVCCAAGYRAAGDKHASLPKVRFEKSEVIDRR